MHGETQRPTHVAARYAALASKPALLWLLLFTGYANESAEIGKLMLAAAIVSIVLGNESHLQFYRVYFSGAASRTTLLRSLRSYIRSLGLHMIILFPLIFIASSSIFPSVDIWLLLLLGIADRVSDEILRIRLYRKEWSYWTRLLFLKHAIPSFLALVILVYKPNWSPHAYVVGNLLFSIYMLLMAMDKGMIKIVAFTIGKVPSIIEIRKYIRIYMFQLFPRQMTAVLAANIILLDRFIGMNFWSSEEIGVIILTGQIIGGVFFITEAKYLSEKRSEFVDNRLNFADFWSWRPYIAVVFACALACASIIIGGQFTGLIPTLSRDGLLVAAVLILSGILFYISIPLKDYLYYRDVIMPLFGLHALLCGIYCLLAIVVMPIKNPILLTTLLMVILLIRTICIFALYGLKKRTVMAAH